VARLADGVEDIKDLKEGMTLEGTVSNVAQFGAFVDLGVHQDGLVHVSQLANKFVTDAREVVKTGDIVKVKVLEVDVARKRISLTMKLDAAPARRDGPETTSLKGQGGTTDNVAVDRLGVTPRRQPQARVLPWPALLPSCRASRSKTHASPPHPRRPQGAGPHP
jgi:transcriptional accessory protein Tex/SPT6